MTKAQSPKKFKTMRTTNFIEVDQNVPYGVNSKHNETCHFSYILWHIAIQNK